MLLAEFGSTIRALVQTKWEFALEIRRHLKRYFWLAHKSLYRSVLPLRYALKARRAIPPPNLGGGMTADRMPVFFINLAARRDRLEAAATEFSRMGIPQAERFDAVKSANGALGCALSHARLLSKFEESNDFLMVCEDDIEFLGSPGELAQVLEDFLENPALDVLCLANNLGSSPHKVSSRLAITSDTATTACYVAKKNAVGLLKSSFEKSADLIYQGEPVGIAAADQLWKKLQRRKLIFAVPRTRIARQRQSFSDIEGREVSYGV